MKYLWTEDMGAGLHFWKLVNQLFFENELVIERKESNQGILDALSNLKIKEENEYYIAFDYVVDNQDIRNKYRSLMGECWYKDCCVSEYPDNLKCGKPKVEDGNEKIRMLIQSEEVQKIINEVIN